MDLGWGDQNQQVGSAAEKILLNTAQAQEKAVDEEINRYDALLNGDDDGLEALRARRIAELQKEQADRLRWKKNGHGTYDEIGGGQDARDVGREFFDATKASDRMVVHFYRNATPSCDMFHKYLGMLAPQHLETRFLKINVQDCDTKNAGGAAFLVEKLGIVVMPTLIVVRNRKVVHHIRGFDELGGTEDFSCKALEYVLGVHGGVQANPDAEVPAELIRAAEGVNRVSLRRH